MEEGTMNDDLMLEVPMYAGETTTTTIIGVSNLDIRDSRALPESAVMSYTLPTENPSPSVPLSEAVVRVGNSLLDARVPESAFLRDKSEEDV
jgi:hypothetical protein